MTDPLKAFMQANALDTPAFAPDSRYYGIETAQWTRPDGEAVTWVRRRFLPAPERLGTLRLHTVAVGDRLDNLAAAWLDDPRQYWRICDGNAVLRPEALTEETGAVIRITLPEGVPGGADD